MPSTITQNIAAVSSQYNSSSQQLGPKEAAANLRPQDINAATQAAADKTTLPAKVSDKERGVQVPKRAEPNFSSDERQERGPSKKAKTKGKSNNSSGSAIDLVA